MYFYTKFSDDCPYGRKALSSSTVYSYWTTESVSYGLPGICLADDVAADVAFTEEA
jgi:hypothetical protein